MSAFYKDVIAGLSSYPKRLSSKYFYDKKGDELFQQIMACPEYYLTDCEMEIFSQQTSALAAALTGDYTEFDIIELGAGDATKSTYLLQHITAVGKTFTYYPVDISKNVINLLQKEMPQRIKEIKVQGLNGEYFTMLQQAAQISQRKKIVLFLGSNIGNFAPQEAQGFLRSVQQHINKGDLLLIGFDLKKHPETILAAYNDAAGITRAFNLNLLDRINRELGADFNLAQFDHYPTYDPVNGACKSYLISLKKQRVCLSDTEVFWFEENEPVHMELSQKYSVQETNALAVGAGFQPTYYLYDEKKWFLDAVWQKT